MEIKHFFDPNTFTLTYLVYDANTKDAVVIDSVLDYDPQGSRVWEESVDHLVDFVKEKGLKVHALLETHAHADHLTGAQYLKRIFPDAIAAIHENIKEVQQTFKSVFNFGDDFDTEGKCFDRLFKDGEHMEFGSIKIEVIHTPGHTPACSSFLINEKQVFTGDALFMPDFGTGRCDFPKGSAKDLYHSIHEKLYKLSDDTEVYVGHDYQPGGRELRFKTSIGKSKKENIHLKAETSETEFVEFRESRDKTLKPPKLLLQSIQVNAQNGNFPKPDSNGVSYLRLPVNKD